MSTAQSIPSDPTARILDAVKGHPKTIQALAGAVAGNDGEAVRAILAERGVALGDEELRAVMASAEGAASGAQGAPNYTMTNTFT